MEGRTVSNPKFYSRLKIIEENILKYQLSLENKDLFVYELETYE